MKDSKLKTFGEYVTWILEQYQALQQKSQHQYLYKITDKKTCEKTRQDILLIQLVGKSLVMKLKPCEIAADDVMLRGFSPLDIRTITYLACKEHFEAKQPKAEQRSGLLYKIIAQAFSRRSKKQMLVIEQTREAEVITASAQQISNKLDMIDGFSPRDAHQIGFAAGMESVIQEKE